MTISTLLIETDLQATLSSEKHYHTVINTCVWFVCWFVLYVYSD